MVSTGSSSSVPKADAAPQAIDVVVVVASRDNAATMHAAATSVREGLEREFEPMSWRVVLADTGSTDGTLEEARAVFDPSSLIELDPEVRSLGKRAAALREALQTAVARGAKYVAVIDAGVPIPEPGRLGRLLDPVATGRFEYASPFYSRHRYDGAITKAIVYPVFRALYGVAIRQPANTEFACSAPLAEHLLAQDFWESEDADAGINMWLAAAAVNRGAGVCEAALCSRPTPPQDQLPDLGTALSQALGALFVDVESRVDVWQRVRGVARTPPLIGDLTCPEPDPLPPGLDRLLDVFRLGYRELREIWTWILPAAAIVELRRAAEAPTERFRLDDALWARIVFDFAFGHALRVMPRDHLLRSFVPLYSAWMASFVLQVENRPTADVEERLDQLAATFEIEKRYLIARWRWPERFRR
jgi:hypothetical protein